VPSPGSRARIPRGVADDAATCDRAEIACKFHCPPRSVDKR
jgi:hypothetical protein